MFPDRRTAAFLSLGGIVLLVAVACGYRLVGNGGVLPRAWKIIAVPAFENRTPWMQLEQRLTGAVVREFVARTRYRIVGEAGGADAVLTGIVLAAESAPVIFDPDTGRATHVLITVRASVLLQDVRSQQVLYQEANFVFREQYEITADLRSFFEERGPALERLARDFAATLVSAVLEGY